MKFLRGRVVSVECNLSVVDLIKAKVGWIVDRKIKKMWEVGPADVLVKVWKVLWNLCIG